MTQAEWAAELAEELYGQQGYVITVVQILDALGCRGLELCPGDGAATAFWESLLAEVRHQEAETE